MWEEEQMNRKLTGLLVCMILVMLLVNFTGCARKGTTAAPKFPQEQQVATPVAPERPAGGALGERPGENVEEGELPIPQTPLARELLFKEASQELQTIYFEYDSAVLKAEAIKNLDRAADWLKKNPGVNVQIEGHCDERGTNEYNLALGERRALAARRYLVSLGINSERIFTISYGEERPSVEGHDESAWKFNRRDEFKISL